MNSKYSKRNHLDHLKYRETILGCRGSAHWGAYSAPPDTLAGPSPLQHFPTPFPIIPHFQIPSDAIGCNPNTTAVDDDGRYVQY